MTAFTTVTELRDRRTDRQGAFRNASSTEGRIISTRRMRN